MLYGRTYLEMRVIPGGGTSGGRSKPEWELGAVKASAKREEGSPQKAAFSDPPSQGGAQTGDEPSMLQAN